MLAPVVDELRPYRGVLFAGMMLTADGPKVLEFNCRFGDPETQVLLPRMPFRVGTLLHACATGRLAFEAGHAGFDEGAAVTVVLASEGYPGSYPTGLPITGRRRGRGDRRASPCSTRARHATTTAGS